MIHNNPEFNLKDESWVKFIKKLIRTNNYFYSILLDKIAEGLHFYQHFREKDHK